MVDMGGKRLLGFKEDAYAAAFAKHK
jgi:hypothetical protein